MAPDKATTKESEKITHNVDQHEGCESSSGKAYFPAFFSFFSFLLSFSDFFGACFASLCGFLSPISHPPDQDESYMGIG